MIQTSLIWFAAGPPRWRSLSFLCVRWSLFSSRVPEQWHHQRVMISKRSGCWMRQDVIVQRIDVNTILPDLVIQVWAACLSGCTNSANTLATFDVLTLLDSKTLQVRVAGLEVD